MDDELNNSNAGEAEIAAESYGKAALLLVESLIHGLIASSLLTLVQAVEIVQTAAEVKQDTVEDIGDSPPALRQSLHLLNSISASLMRNLPHS